MFLMLFSDSLYIFIFLPDRGMSSLSMTLNVKKRLLLSGWKDMAFLTTPLNLENMHNYNYSLFLNHFEYINATATLTHPSSMTSHILRIYSAHWEEILTVWGRLQPQHAKKHSMKYSKLSQLNNWLRNNLMNWRIWRSKRSFAVSVTTVSITENIASWSSTNCYPGVAQFVSFCLTSLLYWLIEPIATICKELPTYLNECDLLRVKSLKLCSSSSKTANKSGCCSAPWWRESYL